MKQKLKIIFFGTPEFAVPSLKILVENNYDVCAVVTAPDKPAGRGQALKESDVKIFAKKNNLKILQPENLKDENWIADLKSCGANLFVIVAFRMLPEKVWKMPELGAFNLHASLLPQYRGAAPINWAIINGEKETGVTTFFLQHEIDTGKIIIQEKEIINNDDDAGALYNRLKEKGAALLLKTVKAIEENKFSLVDQQKNISDQTQLRTAPKLTKELTKINWEKPVLEIHNFIRGLSPYPAAITTLDVATGLEIMLKIFKSEIAPKESMHENVKPSEPVGTILSDKKTFIKVACSDGYLYLKELQLAGKNKLAVKDFLNGFAMSEGLHVH